MAQQSEKKFGIERLKALGAITFDGTMDPTDAKRWPNLMEKCFMVMDCLEEIKVKLAIFLLEVGAEDWSTLYAVRVEGWIWLLRKDFEEECGRSFTFVRSLMRK